jgi:release factor glutamine methyltransferase
MRLDEVLRKGKSSGQDYRLDGLAVEVLLGFVLGKSKEFLFVNPDFEVENDKANEFFALLDRHGNGEPVAYLTNEKEFFGIPFYTDKRVLIPRPETELLVEHVIDLVKKKDERKDGLDKRKVSILDVGTGSCNVPVALALNLDNADVVACDISEEALEVAKINVEKHNLTEKIKLLKSNLLDEFQGMDFDIITANLPYIGIKENNFVAKEAKDFEPNIALFGGDDGLELYREMFGSLQGDVKCDYLLGEIGFSQKDVLRELVLEMFPGKELEFFQDLAGFDRYFVVHFKID